MAPGASERAFRAFCWFWFRGMGAILGVSVVSGEVFGNFSGAVEGLRVVLVKLGRRRLATVGRGAR